MLLILQFSIFLFPLIFLIPFKFLLLMVFIFSFNISQIIEIKYNLKFNLFLFRFHHNINPLLIHNFINKNSLSIRIFKLVIYRKFFHSLLLKY